MAHTTNNPRAATRRQARLFRTDSQPLSGNAVASRGHAGIGCVGTLCRALAVGGNR